MTDHLTRPLAAPFLAAVPEALAVSDRLHASAQDVLVLRALGDHLGRLYRADLAERARLGPMPEKESWAERKRRLTEASSSRYAGTITRAVNAAYQSARDAQFRALADKRKAVRVIESRLPLPIQEHMPPPGPNAPKPKRTKKEKKGYKTAAEWYAKLCRRDHLLGEIADLERATRAGLVSVCCGGKALLRHRSNLVAYVAAAVTDGTLGAEALRWTEVEQIAYWRRHWDAARFWLRADGEAGKAWGNESTHVTPDGAVAVHLPDALAHLANAPFNRYVLSCRVRLGPRTDNTTTGVAPRTTGHAAADRANRAAWLDQVSHKRAVAYQIQPDPDTGRWHITASFSTPLRQDLPTLPSTIAEATDAGCVGVDLNKDHLACWQLDTTGNPVGRPHVIPLDLADARKGVRDARIRNAISELLRWTTEVCKVRAVAIEDLSFAKKKQGSRETTGRAKAYRKMLHTFPTAQFRQRLTAMAARRGVAVVAVDPAYSSKWAAEHWQEPLSPPRHERTRHEAACVVLGRRALGMGARRRVDRSRGGRCTAAGEPPAPGPSHEGTAQAQSAPDHGTATDAAHGHRTQRPRSGGGRASVRPGPARRTSGGPRARAPSARPDHVASQNATDA